MFVNVSGGNLQGSAGAIFWRAVSSGNLIVAETVAREFLSNWLAGKGEIDGVEKPPVMVVYKDAWAALQADGD